MMMMMMMAFQFKVILHLPIIVTIVIEHFHHHCQLSRDRPDFPSLAQTLERLPKKRLARFSNQTRIIFIASPFHLLETQFCVTFKSISLTLILICFQVSFPSHPSVPQCRGALLRLQPSSRDFLEILDVTAHPFPEPPVPLPTSQKMWSWQKVIDISQSTL